MHTHRSLTERFFRGLAKRDADAIAACYAPDAEYSTVLLGRVVGARVPAYWRMICARANMSELRVEAAEADEYGGLARWMARYVCGRQRVRHDIATTFRFLRGRIVRQYDRLEPFLGGRTVGCQRLLHDESSPMMDCLRARGLIALDSFVRERDRRTPPPAAPVRDRRGHRLQPAPRLELTLQLAKVADLERMR